MERQTVQGARREIHFDRFGEVAHDGPILTVDEAHAKDTAALDQLMRVGVALNVDANPLRIERELGDPVEGHEIELEGSVCSADRVEARRHPPQHASAQTVILVAGLIGVSQPYRHHWTLPCSPGFAIFSTVHP